MESKSSGRRKFLKKSVALVGAAAAAAASAAAAAGQPVNGETPMSEMEMPDLAAAIAYGQRSPYVKSKRIPVLERMSPDDFT